MRIRSGSVSLCAAACVLVLGGGLVFSLAAGAAQPWNSTAMPFSTPGPIDGTFDAVSCMSTTSCIAVGKANLPGYEATTAMVANLVGGTWVQGLLPLPSGAATASLAAISCTVSQCQAVGSYASSASGGPSSALIETFSGGGWTATTAVQPSGVTNAELTGVSCVSNSACTAVGDGNVYSGIFTDTLSGATWSAAALSAPTLTGPELDAVSCTAATRCAAVGSSSNSSDSSEPLVEEEHAGAWTSYSDTDHLGVLTSVACTARAACEAGAEAEDGGFFEAFPDSGGAPTETPGAGVSVSSMWCASAGATQCTAWGVDSGPFTPVIQSFSGSSWTTETTSGLTPGISYGTCTSPGSCLAFQDAGGTVSAVNVLTQSSSTSPWATTTLPGPPDGDLRQVSCTTELCMGIGNYYDDTGTEHTFAAELAGGAWSIESLDLLPTNYIETPAVSCEADTCMAVNDGTAAYYDGKGWTREALPVPSGATSVDVGSVSCVSGPWCIAVGAQPDGSDGSAIETFANGAWTAQNASFPAGASGSFSDVTCLVDESCVAVGNGADPSNAHFEALVDTLSGTTWTPTFLPPASGATYGELASVSCSVAGTCTAVGSWFPDYGGVGDPLVATLSGGAWTESTMAPTGGTVANLLSVGCTNTNTCFTVEAAEQTTGEDDTLQKIGAGEVSIPLPANVPAGSISPQSVGCVAATKWCTLAGYYSVPVTGSTGTATYPMIAAVGAPPVTFSSADHSHAFVGQAFSFRVKTASTLADQISEAGLPNGFALSPAGNDDGVITGTATASEVGTYTVDLTASNGVGPAAAQTFTLKIKTS